MSRSLWQYRLYSALPLTSQPWHSCMVTKEEHGGINLSTEQPFSTLSNDFTISHFKSTCGACVCVCKCVGPESEGLHRAEQTILQGTGLLSSFQGKPTITGIALVIFQQKYTKNRLSHRSQGKFPGAFQVNLIP